MNKSQYDKKIRILIKWANAYYINNNPEATDEEYDKLNREILEFERNNPLLVDENTPTRRVGGTVLEAFEKAAHLSPMWSQEDIFNSQELENWIKRISKLDNNLSFLCEPKFDGASLNLIYNNGRLIKAISRGDGQVGEDITLNVKTIKSVPLFIKYNELIEIRGEVVIKKEDFNLINKQRLESNNALFANPRNAASGSLRQLDSSVTAKRKLFFNVWGVGENKLTYKKSSQVMEFIYSLGFKKPPIWKICATVKEIEELYKEIISQRDKISMGLDGMVIKVDSLELRDILGYTVKYPKWSCAYKFPAVEKVTTVNNIIYQVGRTGVITPVALVEPILIDGSVVQRATLHNFDEIKRLDLMLYDKVIIIKSGDIIPKITKVLIDRRDNRQQAILLPTICPSCNSKLFEEDILVKCQNIKCPSRVINSIIYFTSKNCMNIDGLGSKIVELLVKEKRIKDILDLYSLTFNDLQDLDGFKDKKINNILKAINNSKNCALYRVVNALGIEHIGEVASKQICNEFGLKIVDVTYDELILLDGIGDQMALSFVNFIKINLESIKKLFSIIGPTVEEKSEILDNVFKDKIVVLTGAMELSRNIIKNQLEDLGAKVTNSVSKKTDFLIYGKDASSKYNKAIKLGIKIIDESMFKKMIENNNC